MEDVHLRAGEDRAAARVSGVKAGVEASAPGRAGIIGNPSDMYGGSVISCTIPHRARCRIVPAGELCLQSGSLTARPRSRADLALRGDNLDIQRAVLGWLGLDPQRFAFHIRTSTTIPSEAGLAGSTAMLAAVLAAVARILDLHLDGYEMAETARRIEAEQMGVACGFQDQHMAVFGGFNYMDFRGKESLKQHPDEPYATVERLPAPRGGLPFLLAHTGIKRSSGAVHRTIRERWEAGDRDVVEGQSRIAQLARIGKKAILDEDWKTLGRLMDENHEIQSALGGSGEVCDELIRTARQAGALGAKLAGAGHGGTIIALTLDPGPVASALIAAGAQRTLTPRPVRGLLVRPLNPDS